MKKEWKYFSLVMIIILSLQIITARTGILNVNTDHPFLINGKWIAASELKVGDSITTVDRKKARIISIEDISNKKSESSDKNPPEKVINIFKFLRYDYFVIKTDSTEDIKVTGEHPFYLDGKWILVKDLKMGDFLLTDKFEKTKIISIEKVHTNNPFYVYNLEVDGLHNYYANNLLVHNKPIYVSDYQSRIVLTEEIDPSSVDFSTISSTRKVYLDNIVSLDRTIGPIDLEGVSDSERIYLFEQILKKTGLVDSNGLTESEKRLALAAHYSEIQGSDRIQAKYNMLRNGGFTKDQIKIGIDDWIFGIIRSKVKKNPTLRKIAEDLPDNIKNEINNLMTQFNNGNTNPGIKNKCYKAGNIQIIELRSKNGARVYLTPVNKYYPSDLTKTDFEILGYSDKLTQQKVINIIKENF